MPSLGVSDRQTFLTHAQGFKFNSRTPTPLVVTDTTGRTWPVIAGNADADERNFGLFDGDQLVARLTIQAPDPNGDCPTPYWSIGKIEVVNSHQKRGLGRRLIEQVFGMLGAPLASDLNQTPEGASIWRHLIPLHPGKIELHDGAGGIVPVAIVGGACSPDPWSFPEWRLVRLP